MSTNEQGVQLYKLSDLKYVFMIILQVIWMLLGGQWLKFI